MRRLMLIPSLALALTLVSASSAEATLYRGGGKGVDVVFRAQGRQLVVARVSARLYCVTGDGKRHFSRVKKLYATPGSPLRLDRNGKFRWDSSGRPQEEGFTEEEFFAGRVGSNFVTGRFEYFRSINLRHRRVKCQTGSYPFGPSAVTFRARRQVGGS